MNYKTLRVIGGVQFTERYRELEDWVQGRIGVEWVLTESWSCVNGKYHYSVILFTGSEDRAVCKLKFGDILF
jgi:hypothetical protein